MHGFLRSEPPAVLTDPHPDTQKPRWETVGDDYAQRRSEKPGHQFRWPSVDGKRLNKHLVPLLDILTDAHCAYCDNYPLRDHEDSIDHFLPKSNPAFYTLVCQWENLYLSCGSCQKSKREQYVPALLRPDEFHYSFSRFFVYNYRTHQILANPGATADEQNRATITIAVFGLNNTGHCIARRHAVERYEKTMDPDLSDFSYRFMLA
jgi:uncharacterized protein (TIGR02646 family)